MGRGFVIFIRRLNRRGGERFCVSERKMFGFYSENVKVCKGEVSVFSKNHENIVQPIHFLDILYIY